MIKLKTIIGQLEEDTYRELSEDLSRNKSANFLFLLNAYRNNNISDSGITEHLQITNNSLYVLKSRLFDKIQEKLSGNIFSTKEEAIRKLHQIPQVLFSQPREMSDAFLQKLEKDLLAYDMHSELLTVYSALKKVHFYSDRYFHYSQQYNKHAAFNLSLEKSEELLANFNRVMGQYHFGRTETYLSNLLFLRKQIADHQTLNPSRQIRIIDNISTLQLAILFNVGQSDTDVEALLKNTENLISELPEGATQKSWLYPLDYLYFEHYFFSGQKAQWQRYFQKVEENLSKILLFNHVALTSRFLVTRWKCEERLPGNDKELYFDTNDIHTAVLVSLNRAMTHFSQNKYKEAASALNDILNTTSLKDYLHFNIELRLTLAFFYIQQDEFDLAEYLLKNLTRKIKAEQPDRYAHALRLIKVFNSQIRQPGPVSDTQRDEFLLFKARNNNEYAILPHLMAFLDQRYK